ncbi:hypothetical protein TNCV_1330151 [Trichonephila clavipes]|uniref:Uncharacterized protein n=1 Tax=Trichonephila clavipes TaxID=2585209 RepID=A0A8X6RBT0_TRICX|nr:hypothetical protein TNCV_1330151 [Trichonephila clavipes]
MNCLTAYQTLPWPVRFLSNRACLGYDGKGLSATDQVILNYGQETKTKPELALPSPNFYTTPMGGCLSLDIFNMHRLSVHGGTSAVLSSN